MSPTQLALDLGLRDDATFANFCNINNELAYNALQATLAGAGDQVTYLWGEAGVGKTHLLQAACHLANDKQISAVYISLQTDRAAQHENILQGLENINLVCLDNIHAIAKQNNWEEAVFNLFNKLRAKQNKLLLSADKPPIQLKLGLPDLKSRLSWGVVYQLHHLRDEDKLSALKVRASQRGLELEDTVGWFLLRRYSRSMADLLGALDFLDHASLEQQRRLTVPFVKQTLGI